MKSVVPAPRVVEVPVAQVPDGLAEAVDDLRGMIDVLRGGVDRMADRVGELADAVTQGAAEATATSDPMPEPAPPESSPATAARSTAVADRPMPPSAVQASVPANGKVTATRAILNSLAELARFGIGAPSRAQLALWLTVGIKSSGYANNLGKLRTAGLIDYPTGGHVSLTAAGETAAAQPAITPTTAELHRRISQTVHATKWRLLEVLIDIYPASVTRTELAERAGISPTSSGYANNLGALRTLGLLDYPQQGHVAATDVLFLAGARS